MVKEYTYFCQWWEDNEERVRIAAGCCRIFTLGGPIPMRQVINDATKMLKEDGQVNPIVYKVDWVDQELPESAWDTWK